MVWIVFQPGLMTSDSMEQLRQASSGEFTDWHPPLLALLLRILLPIGGVGAYTFLQSQMIAFGLLAFILYSLPRKNGLPYRIAALLTILLLMIPPLPYYLVTVWKDAALLAALLWFLAGIRMIPHVLTARGRSAAIGVAVLSATAAGLLRHNMLLWIPFAGGSIALATRPYFRHAVVLATVPLFALFLAGTLLDASWNVKRADLTAILKAGELVAMCHTHPEHGAALPYTQKTLLPAYPVDVPKGAPVARFLDRSYFLGPAYLDIFDARRIHEEYAIALRRAPWVLLEIKWLAASNMLALQHTLLWHAYGIMKNDFGIQAPPALQPARDFLIHSADPTLLIEPLRLILASHWIWIMISIVMTILEIDRFRRNPEHAESLLDATLLGIPLIGLVSFLPFAVTPDFRYLYPFTLCTQAVVLVKAASAFGGMSTPRVLR